MTSRISTHNRIASKYNVQLIDFTPLHQQALDYVNMNESKEDKPLSTSCTPNHKYGFIETADGIYLVDSEGVGNSRPITEENPYHLSFYTERRDKENFNQKYISIFPSCEMPLFEKHLRKYATGETQPLHEFIREFGLRLDNNYMNWERHLDGVTV
tara:strand:- start:119 stop:586 length:468 start_codon:yes stop_codon:yes gene_type:complete